VDLTTRVKVHYSMDFALVNFVGEVLCVSKSDSEDQRRVECKKFSRLDKGDKCVFKVIDINEPSNAGPVHFNSSIWLQVVSDASDATAAHPGSTGGPSAWEQGVVLGAKLYAAPSMTSLQAAEAESEDSDEDTYDGEGDTKSPADNIYKKLSSASVLRRGKGAEPHRLLTSSLSSKAIARNRARKEAKTALCGSLVPVRMVHAPRAADGGVMLCYSSTSCCIISNMLALYVLY
jgi:hypothetical protein